jgi:hypothetical protein
MKMVAEYLDKAINFETMAAGEKNEKLKESLLAQAMAYRKLAAERAAQFSIKMPPPQSN